MKLTGRRDISPCTGNTIILGGCELTSFTKVGPSGALVIEVDHSVYSVPALLRTCYWYTDRAYILIARGRTGSYEVQFSPKDDGQSLEPIVGEFANALLDNQLRATLASETEAVRSLIVAKAFAEGGLLDSQESPHTADPVLAGQGWDTMISGATGQS